MTPSETVRLVGVISQVWPSMKLDSHTPDAWSLIFDDVALADALDAVRHLAKVRTGYISPADIRRQIATTHGLMAPSEAAGLAAAAAVAGRQGEGASKLDPVTYAAYRAMGGPTAFEEKQAIIRPQWGRVWAECLREHEDRTLSGNLGELVEATRRTAITAAPAPTAVAAIEAPTTDRSKEIAEFIRGINGPGDPDKLHQRKAWWRRQQRPERVATPNPHFAGYARPEETA
jgi:hypothetical protein